MEGSLCLIIGSDPDSAVKQVLAALACAGAALASNDALHANPPSYAIDITVSCSSSLGEDRDL